MCPTLCDPIDGSPTGSAIPGILQARTLEWVAISFSNAWKWKVKVKSLSKCLTLCDPMDCSLPGSSIHGIFQARVLEWGAIAFFSILNTAQLISYISAQLRMILTHWPLQPTHSTLTASLSPIVNYWCQYILNSSEHFLESSPSPAYDPLFTCN